MSSVVCQMEVSQMLYPKERRRIQTEDICSAGACLLCTYRHARTRIRVPGVPGTAATVSVSLLETANSCYFTAR